MLQEKKTNVAIYYLCQTILAIFTESLPSAANIQPPSVQPPTTMSSFWGRTATRDWWWGVAMWLMTSQELVVLLYMWIAFDSSSSETYPPTVSSRPCSETHGEKENGVSANWCHTLGLLIESVFNCAFRYCGWQDWRRAASEQVNTDLEYFKLPSQEKPARM